MAISANFSGSSFCPFRRERAVQRPLRQRNLEDVFLLRRRCRCAARSDDRQLRPTRRESYGESTWERLLFVGGNETQGNCIGADTSGGYSYLLCGSPRLLCPSFAPRGPAAAASLSLRRFIKSMMSARAGHTFGFGVLSGVRVEFREPNVERQIVRRSQRLFREDDRELLRASSRHRRRAEPHRASSHRRARPSRPLSKVAAAAS